MTVRSFSIYLGTRALNARLSAAVSGVYRLPKSNWELELLFIAKYFFSSYTHIIINFLTNHKIWFFFFDLGMYLKKNNILSAKLLKILIVS